MQNEQTRRLLQEIDESEVIKEYMQEVCDDMYSVLHKMSQCINSRAPDEGPCRQGTRPCQHYRYEQTMHVLKSLGTMRNSTHPGSVRSCDVDGVLRSGNIRERCAVLMNMLCHDKRYGIIQWLLVKAACPEKCKKCCDPSNAKPQETMPAAVNVQQLVVYTRALGICAAASRPTTSFEPCAKKDIRKALYRVVNCPHKKFWIPRPFSSQYHYALKSSNAIPKFSWREWALQRACGIHASIWHSNWPSRYQQPSPSYTLKSHLLLSGCIQSHYDDDDDDDDNQDDDDDDDHSEEKSDRRKHYGSGHGKKDTSRK